MPTAVDDVDDDDNDGDDACNMLLVPGAVLLHSPAGAITPLGDGPGG